MRRVVWAGLLVLGVIGTAGGALADVEVTEDQRSYDISGRTGAALLEAMDRRGPKHGFLTRAIAQTRYSVFWTIEWGETRSACRLKRTDGTLAITYTYPRLSGQMTPALKRRWDKFIAGVRRHETVHGQLARQMARAAEKSVAGLTIRDDPGCRKSRLEVKRRMAAVYADYEARQNRFDAKEHGPGGKVEALIENLLR